MIDGYLNNRTKVTSLYFEQNGNVHGEPKDLRHQMQEFAQKVIAFEQEMKIADQQYSGTGKDKRLDTMQKSTEVYEQQQEKDEEPASDNDMLLTDVDWTDPVSANEFHDAQENADHPPSPETDLSIYAEMIEQMLVSGSDTRTAEQVHIAFKDEVIDGAQVRIINDEKSLSVEWLAGTKASYHFLTTEKSNLRKQLEKKLNRAVGIHVVYDEGGDAAASKSSPAYRGTS